MKRFPDWPARLAAQIEKAHGSKFAWGTFDCGLNACDAALAITGTDPGEGLRGTYHTEAEAQTVIGNDLGKFAASIAERLKAAEVPRFYARRGDLVLVDNAMPGLPGKTPPSVALGFVDLGGRYVLCASETGLTRVPMRRWLRAWRIG